MSEQQCRALVVAGRQAELEALRARCAELEQEVDLLRARLDAVAWIARDTAGIGKRDR